MGSPQFVHGACHDTAWPLGWTALHSIRLDSAELFSLSYSLALSFSARTSLTMGALKLEKILPGTSLAKLTNRMTTERECFAIMRSLRYIAFITRIKFLLLTFFWSYLYLCFQIYLIKKNTSFKYFSKILR